MTEHLVGSVHARPANTLADLAARIVMEHVSPRCVTLDPDGKVWVEPPEHAAEPDIVGVYQGLGLLELSRKIGEDLRYEVQVRGLRERPRQYRRMSA